MGSTPLSEEDLKNRMMEKFFDTLMTNPQAGMTQMQNLITVQKMMQDNGFIGDKKNGR